MKKTFKIKPPIMPNYVQLEMPPGKRQDGLQMDKGKIPISDLTREEAEEFGELMKQTFIKHWERSIFIMAVNCKSNK
jgi:hypothetical protein